MQKLEGKVALVSGSGRGIGRATARKLASEGARVVVNDLDAEVAQAVVEEIKQLGSEAVACSGDVGAPDFGERFVKTALDTYGTLDIIVNNAGYTWDNVIQKMSDEQFQAILNVHLVAPFRILRAASEYIRSAAKKEAAEGHVVIRKVVNVSSISGLLGQAGQANYSSAKAGVIGLTHALCKEWGRYNVTVNAVAFGFIKTRMTVPITPGEEQKTVSIAGREVKIGIQADHIKALEASIPLGRAGEPEDAANAIYLFCCPESNFISGQVLVCSGGGPI